MSGGQVASSSRGASVGGARQRFSGAALSGTLQDRIDGTSAGVALAGCPTIPVVFSLFTFPVCALGSRGAFPAPRHSNSATVDACL